MKRSYRFVGDGFSLVGDQEFSQFGQRAEFTDEFEKMVVLGGAAFISQDKFDELEFDEEQLMRYFSQDYYGELPADLIEKKEAAQHAFRERRAELHSAVK